MVVRAKTHPTYEEANDELGISVAISGDTSVIGDGGDDIERGYDSGSGYMYTNIGGKWINNGKIVPDDGVSTEKLGIVFPFWGYCSFCHPFRSKWK